jgi:acetyl esterase/lipase
VLAPDPQKITPIVKSSASYEVLVEEDIVYGEGLSHQALNNDSFTRLPLKLDVYVPNNESKNRPVFLFFHGGAFVGGSKQQAKIINLANYYTSRGWVFLSVDYRLRDDKGSVPQAWKDHSLQLANHQVAKFLAMYPAIRDAKAAMRWTMANAEKYNINTAYITVGGASAGAVMAIGLGVSNPEDFRDEIEGHQDPSLASTNMGESYTVKTIIDFWGSKVALDILERVYAYQRFDRQDPPLFIAHGTLDPIVPYAHAEDLKAIYDSLSVPVAYYPLEGLGHGAWNARINNRRLEELAFNFIVEEQKLKVEN